MRGILDKLLPKRLCKCTVCCLQLLFSQQNGISVPKGARHDLSDGWDRTKGFQSKGRNAQVPLKAKQIQERNPTQSVVLWISLQQEIRGWKCASNDYTENFATVLQERFACKQKDTDLPTLLRASGHRINNMTFLASESSNSDSWKQKIKKVKLSKNSSRSKDFASDELTLELCILISISWTKDLGWIYTLLQTFLSNY